MKLSRRTLNIVAILYLAALAYLMYEMALDPDPDERKLSRLHVRYRAYQRAAERIGQLGIDAEKEYHALLESRRTI